MWETFRSWLLELFGIVETVDKDITQEDVAEGAQIITEIDKEAATINGKSTS